MSISKTFKALSKKLQTTHDITKLIDNADYKMYCAMYVTVGISHIQNERYFIAFRVIQNIKLFICYYNKSIFVNTDNP